MFGMPDTLKGWAVLTSDFLLVFVLISVMDTIFWMIFENDFQRMVMNVQRMPPRNNWMSVATLYMHMVACYFYFVIMANMSVFDAFWVGFWIYGVCDLTNYATFASYDERFIVINTMWGSVLFAVTAAIFYVYKGKSIF